LGQTLAAGVSADVAWFPRGGLSATSVDTTDGTTDVNPTSELLIGAGLVLTQPSPGVAELVVVGPQARFAAQISRSTNQAIANSTKTDIVFDTVDFATAGMVNLVTNPKIITCVEAGIYNVQGQFQVAPSASGSRNLDGILNGFYSLSTGTTILNAITAGVSGQTLTMVSTLPVALNVGDFVSLGINQNSGGSLNVLGVGILTSLTVALVSQ
jgi:hypothetical protein